MKKLASEFANYFVDIVNARTECSVLEKSQVGKKIKMGRPTRKFDSVHCFAKRNRRKCID